MRIDEDVAIANRSPDAVLNFWLGPLRTAADASRRNWQQGMLRWRLGPSPHRPKPSFGARNTGGIDHHPRAPPLRASAAELPASPSPTLS